MFCGGSTIPTWEYTVCIGAFLRLSFRAIFNVNQTSTAQLTHSLTHLFLCTFFTFSIHTHSIFHSAIFCTPFSYIYFDQNMRTATATTGDVVAAVSLTIHLVGTTECTPENDCFKTATRTNERVS